MGDVNPWIYNAVERGVSELKLSIKTRYNRCPPSELGVVIGPKDTGEIFLGFELVMCKTLVKLTLGTQITLGNIPPDMCLLALKSLFIDSIFFTGEYLYKVLLPGCPVLEELSVHHEDFEGMPWCIASKTIKKLSVYYDVESEVDFMAHGMSFDASNLVSLDYYDYALYKYPQVNLGPWSKLSWIFIILENKSRGRI
ncbi:unnamed protein product [Arabis nemorensis]|uniref:F-box/LRR-repeat protein 15/At3g58940/PEG3-like LRR domain-containing protein n=1 Tax=Arabis nemorensis TaxID=586526 RepID=A0A565BY13_9BRAS|nr:unnamed protein product [Arabis nemorensis]